MGRFRQHCANPATLSNCDFALPRYVLKHNSRLSRVFRSPVIVGGYEQTLEKIMKKLVASVLALSVFTSAAMAGGPVVVVEEPAPVVEESAGTSSGAFLPLLLVGIALAVALD
jgi:hypothetical protein